MLGARPARRKRPAGLDLRALDLHTLAAPAPPDPGVLCVLAAYACGELQARVEAQTARAQTARAQTARACQPLALRVEHGVHVCARCGAPLPRSPGAPLRAELVVLPLAALPLTPHTERRVSLPEETRGDPPCSDKLHLCGAVCFACRGSLEQRGRAELETHAALVLRRSDTAGQTGSAVRMYAATYESACAAPAPAPAPASLAERWPVDRSRLQWRAGVLQFVSWRAGGACEPGSAGRGNATSEPGASVPGSAGRGNAPLRRMFTF